MNHFDFHKQTTLPSFAHHSTLSLKAPKQIGPYHIDALLSKGSMTYLYLGSDNTKNIPLVIKVLSPQFMAHPEMVDQFLKEAEIIALTDHPNIIKLHGQGQWEKGLYIAMEFVQGISLKQFIMQQHLSIRHALDVILQVAYALLHLHTHGVIHRDLKPENILITENGQIKVIDFGIAQLTQDKRTPFLPKKGEFLGTPSYMSPEQKKDPLNVTCATDIYSLGVLSFELIAGKLSHGSIDLTCLPKKLQPYIAKTLQPSLTERYQDIVDFITDISHYLKYHLSQGREEEKETIQGFLNKLKDAQNVMLPKTQPKWPPFDIGLAYMESPPFNAFYDFVRLADQSYLIFLGNIDQNPIESLALIGILKGIIHTLTYQAQQSATTQFVSISCITTLNDILLNLQIKSPIACYLFHLKPLTNEFSFISCGFESIIHIKGETMHFLSNSNPPLGQAAHHNFDETSKNWEEGDVLLAHSFNSVLTQEGRIKHLDRHMRSFFPLCLHLSGQRQAEELLKALHETNNSLSPLSCILTIQRIT